MVEQRLHNYYVFRFESDCTSPICLLSRRKYINDIKDDLKKINDSFFSSTGKILGNGNQRIIVIIVMEYQQQLQQPLNKQLLGTKNIHKGHSKGGFPLGDKCRTTRCSIVKIEQIFNQFHAWKTGNKRQMQGEPNLASSLIYLTIRLEVAIARRCTLPERPRLQTLAGSYGKNVVAVSLQWQWQQLCSQQSEISQSLFVS